MASFYADVAGLRVVEEESDHAVLAREGFQLVVVGIPPHIAETIELEDPVVRREDSALKLVFPVSSIGAARVVATERGGTVDPPEREWSYGRDRVCDGHDPEGNVIQLREDVG